MTDATSGTARTGGCLCGAVRFSVALEAAEFSACHCSMCRRWIGSPMLAVHCPAPITWQGEEHIVRYRSSEWAERCFCGRCGSSLFYFLIPTGETVLALGAFDDQDGFAMTSQIFIDEKPAGYAFANDTPTMTGPEVFAMYAPKVEPPGEDG
ncbi:GFA family protein [Roseospira navarrensis]|uniref:GFA family protein n=1 Tax=Roseospira navarrensis TaxID=140058 RepID=A0A7X1ZI96_9PROT|nr:GFA family protein [Roseospira navarrensis]MQX37740.1 GFA family protein [Roseospira navarrensis]